MSLLGAGDLGEGGKQKSTPTESRSKSFNPYAGLGPNFHGVGGMSGDTSTNVARAKSTVTTSNPKPQSAGPVTQGVPTSVRNAAVSQIKKEGEVKHLAKGVVGAAAKSGNLVKDIAVETAKSAGRLGAVTLATATGDESLNPYAKPGGGEDWKQEGMDILTFLPYGKIGRGVAKGMVKGSKGVVKGVGSIKNKVWTEPITANAAQSVETVTAAGRRPVGRGSKPPTKTGKKPPTFNPGAGPMSRQLAEYAPKSELANIQPIRMVDDYSRAFGDNPESNSREVINSLYRRAQQIAESEGRQIFSTNKEHALYDRKPYRQTDIQRAAENQWSEVYDQMIKDGTLSKEEYPTNEDFLDFIRGYSHVDLGGNMGEVTPTLKAANDAFLERFHGEGASKKPIAYYRNASSNTGDPIIDASGDYSLDRTMAYNYGRINRDKNRIRMDVTTDSLRHPIVPLYRSAYNGEVRLDEWAQNWSNKKWNRGVDWDEGGIVEGIQPKVIGRQLQDVYPFSDDQRFRDFASATRYGIKDYEFAGDVTKIPDDIVKKYDITEDELKTWDRLRDKHFTPVYDEQGNLTGRSLVNKRASEYGVEAAHRNENPVGGPLSYYDHQVMRKVSDAMYDAGLIKEPFHYNKFDIPKRKDGVKRPTITGDTEGFYGQINKAKQSFTIREGVTE